MVSAQTAFKYHEAQFIEHRELLVEMGVPIPPYILRNYLDAQRMVADERLGRDASRLQFPSKKASKNASL